MKLIKEEIVFQGKIIEVAQQTVKIDNKELLREIARRSPWVRLIICNGDKILLTKEFRRDRNGRDYRLPWGKVFDTLKEYNQHKYDIKKYSLLAVKREAEEEAWLIPLDPSLWYISKVWSTIERDLHYYVVHKFVQHPKWQHVEAGENITVEWKTKQEIKNIVKIWWMQEDRSVGVLLRYLE